MMKQKEPRLRLMFPWYLEEWVSHFFFFCLRSHSVHTLSHTYTLVHWCLCLNTSCVVCKARSLIAQLWNFFLVFFMYATVSFLLVFVTGLNKCRFKNEEKHFFLFISKDICWYLCTQCPQLAAVQCSQPFLISSLCTWLFVLFTQNQSKYRCSLSTVWQA